MSTFLKLKFKMKLGYQSWKDRKSFKDLVQQKIRMTVDERLKLSKHEFHCFLIAQGERIARSLNVNASQDISRFISQDVTQDVTQDQTQNDPIQKQSQDLVTITAQLIYLFQTGVDPDDLQQFIASKSQALLMLDDKERERLLSHVYELSICQVQKQFVESIEKDGKDFFHVFKRIKFGDKELRKNQA